MGKPASSDLSAEPASATGVTIGKYRWVVCALLFFATTINYIDRQILALLKEVLDQQIGWTNEQFGWVNSAFQIAYGFGLLGFGWFVDRFGTKIGYAISIAAWSLAAAAHAFVGSIGGFLVARSALGLGEGGNFPSAIKSVANWFPKSERAFATSIFNSGTNAGALIAPAVVPWLAYHYGWKSAFIAAAIAGLIWLCFWLPFYEVPEKSRRVGEPELRYIQSSAAESDVMARPSWPTLLQYRQTWSFVLAKFLTDPVWWFYLYWLPPYLYDVRKFDLKQIGWALPVVYLMADFGSVGGGWLSGYLIRRGWTTKRARRGAMTVCALCMPVAALAVLAPGPVLTIALIGLANSAHQGWSANLFTITSDTFPRGAVASVTGIGGCAGGIGGFLFSAVIPGFVVSHFGYKPMFGLMGTIHVIALLAMFPLLKQKAAP